MDNNHETGVKFTNRYKLFHMKNNAFCGIFELTTKVSFCLIANKKKSPFSLMICVGTYSTVIGPSKTLKAPILSKLGASRNNR